jgi:type IV pilus assembly protein PilA
MPATLKTRLCREQGFTLIELLVVIIILGVLLGIAIPSYLSSKDRATKAAVQMNIRAIVPDLESWNADNDGNATDVDGNAGTSGYQGMTMALLKSNYDQSIVSANYTLSGQTTTSYCVQTSKSGWTAYKQGPDAVITVVQGAGPC